MGHLLAKRTTCLGYVWGSRKQNCVALSSCEAEIIALSEAAKYMVYLRKFISGMTGKQIVDSSVLRTDNKAARDLSYNPELHNRTKHVARWRRCGGDGETIGDGGEGGGGCEEGGVGATSSFAIWWRHSSSPSPPSALCRPHHCHRPAIGRSRARHTAPGRAKQALSARRGVQVSLSGWAALESSDLWGGHSRACVPGQESSLSGVELVCGEPVVRPVVVLCG